MSFHEETIECRWLLHKLIDFSVCLSVFTEMAGVGGRVSSVPVNDFVIAKTSLTECTQEEHSVNIAQIANTSLPSSLWTSGWLNTIIFSCASLFYMYILFSLNLLG